MKREILFRILIWFPAVAIPLFYVPVLLDPGLLSRYMLLIAYLFVLMLFITISFIVNHRKGNSSIYNLKKFGYFDFLKNPLLLFYSGFIIFSFISISYSINKPDGWFDFSRSMLGFIFIILTYMLYKFTLSYSSRPYTELQSDFIAEIVRSISVLNLIIGFIGMVQFGIIASSGSITHQTMHALNGTFIHKNLFSEMLLLSMPFGIFVFFKHRGLWKYIGFTGASLSTALIVVSLTRAVWVAGIAAAAGTLMVYIASVFFSRHGIKKTDSENNHTFIPFKKKRKNNLLWYVAGVFVIGIVMLFGELDRENALVKQIVSVYDYRYGSAKERLVLWDHTLDIFSNKPLIGEGLGSWRIAILKYGNKDLKSEDNVTFYTRPHNDFLWVLAETGIIGFLFFAGIWLSAFICLFRIRPGFDNKPLFYLLFYVFSAYLIFSFFSFPRERIEHLIIIGLAIVIIVILKDQQRDTALKNNVNGSIRNVYMVLLIIFSLLALCFYIGFLRTKAELHLRKAFVERKNGNPLGVIKEIAKSENCLYKLDPFSTPLKWYSGEAHFKLGNIDDAFKDFNDACLTNPYHVHVLNNLATCFELKNDHNNALRFYEKAIDLSPDFTDALINIAAVSFNKGNTDKALEYIARVDTSSEHRNFKPYLLTILKDYLYNFISHTQEESLKKQIIEISNTDIWIYDIYIKSRKNKITFKRQLLLDAIYNLEVTKKQLTFAQADTLRKKYKL